MVGAGRGDALVKKNKASLVKYTTHNTTEKMNSPSSRLLKINPTIPSSVSTPDLFNLERKFSLSKSADDRPASSTIPINLSTVTVGDTFSLSTPNLPLRDSEMISSSAPGSLQSSPRKHYRERDTVPLAATPEAVDRPRLTLVCVIYFLYF